LFLCVLAVGAALRVVTLLAYRPALLYPDSLWYLLNAAEFQPALLRPMGYSMFLRLLPIEHGWRSSRSSSMSWRSQLLSCCRSCWCGLAFGAGWQRAPRRHSCLTRFNC
jgi:hypothetical protein